MASPDGSRGSGERLGARPEPDHQSWKSSARQSLGSLQTMRVVFLPTAALALVGHKVSLPRAAPQRAVDVSSLDISSLDPTVIGGAVAAVGAAAVLAGKGGDGAAAALPRRPRPRPRRWRRRRGAATPSARRTWPAGAGPVLLVVAARGRRARRPRSSRPRRPRRRRPRRGSRASARAQRAARHAARGLVRLALLVAGPRRGGVQQGPGLRAFFAVLERCVLINLGTTYTTRTAAAASRAPRPGSARCAPAAPATAPALRPPPSSPPDRSRR